MNATTLEKMRKMKFFGMFRTFKTNLESGKLEDYAPDAMIANIIEWIDACYCLKRTVEIPKLARGGSRSFRVHLNSMDVINPEAIKGRIVFLLDDVSTT